MAKQTKILADNNGYALTYVLFINLLIFSSVLALLGVIFFYNTRSIKAVLKTKLDLACYSAVQILLTDTTYLSKQEVTLMCDSIKVNILERQFGLFREVIASASSGRDSSAYKCLIGCDLIQPFDNAVTITHPRALVTIAGVTNITGNMAMTSKGITKGNVFGIRNSNENYIEGKVLIDANLQTKFFTDSLITNVFNNRCTDGTNAVTLKTTILNNDFFNKNPSQQYYIIDGNLTLKDSIYAQDSRSYYFNVSGTTTFESNCFSNQNLIIYSDSTIQIGSKSCVENALLVSKAGICCEESFFKNVQLFSQDSVIINNSCFNYPSVIANYTSTADTAKLNNHITLMNSVFNGSIIQVSSTAGLDINKSKITIDKQSKVQGIVYSDNNVELLGKLYGSIYTYNFYYYKQPSEYINWLIDIYVNRDKLDKWFLIPMGFKSENNYEIITEKWLY